MESFIPLLIFLAFLALLILAAGGVVELTRKLLNLLLEVPIIIIRSLQYGGRKACEISKYLSMSTRHKECIQTNQEIFYSYHFLTPQTQNLNEKECTTSLGKENAQSITITISFSGIVYSICLMLEDLNANLLGLIAEISNSCRAEGAIASLAYSSCNMGCTTTFASIPLVLDACKRSKGSWQDIALKHTGFESLYLH